MMRYAERLPREDGVRSVATPKAISSAIIPSMPPVARFFDSFRYEIKHDGFRIMALRDAASVRLFTRNGYNLARAVT